MNAVFFLALAVVRPIRLAMMSLAHTWGACLLVGCKSNIVYREKETLSTDEESGLKGVRCVISG